MITTPGRPSPARLVVAAAALLVLVAGVAVVLLLKQGAMAPDVGTQPELPAAAGPSARDLRTVSGRRVVIVGVDGLDWQMADPLMAAGRMPHLARLVESGVRADLRSSEPMLSPLLWTTMATGRLPEDHGILDFLATDAASGAPVPIPSTFRKVPALWTIASTAGLENAFVGWWATWPAEPVLGSMVSDRLAWSLLEQAAGDATPLRVAFPPALDREAPRLVVRPEDVDAQLLGRFVKDAGRRGGDERVAHLRKAIAGTLTYQRVALHLLDSGTPQLVGIYHELVDQAGHLAMHFAPPRRSDVSQSDFEAFSHAVEAAYVLEDELLGEVMARVPGEAVLVVVSDHGFLSAGSRPSGTADVAGRPGHWHRDTGVFVAAGAGIPAAGSLQEAHVEDIAPTVLHLLGLPAGADMPGQVLLSADEDARRIPTWDVLAPVQHLEAPRAAPAMDAAAVEQLRALGYVSLPAPGEGTTAAGAAEALPAGAATYLPTAAHQLNLARSLLLRRRSGEASEAALASLALSASQPEAWGILSRAAEAQGDLVGALAASERGVAASPAGAAGAGLRHVELLLRLGRPAEAEAFTASHPEVAAEPALLGLLALSRGDAEAAAVELRRALARQPGDHVSRARLASALMLSGHVHEAVGEARTVRAAAPDEPEAWVLVAAVLGRGGDHAAALDSARQALRLGSADPSALVTEAVALAELGEMGQARDAVKAGLRRHPGDTRLQELAAALAE